MFRFAQYDREITFAFWSPPVLRRFLSFPSNLLRQLAKPPQGDGSLRVVNFMAAVERADSNSGKAGPFDRADNIVLLLYGSDSIIAAGTDVDRRIKKSRARANFRVSIAQVIFVGAGNVDSGDAATTLCD